MIEKDDLETQFKTFFPNLNENNWKKLLDDRATRFNHNETPYHLRIENIHGYGTYQPCEWCGTKQCRTNCPLPFSTQTTVLDMLNKLGVDDNTSFFQDNRGK